MTDVTSICGVAESLKFVGRANWLFLDGPSTIHPVLPVGSANAATLPPGLGNPNSATNVGSSSIRRTELISPQERFRGIDRDA